MRYETSSIVCQWSRRKTGKTRSRGSHTHYTMGLENTNLFCRLRSSSVTLPGLLLPLVSLGGGRGLLTGALALASPRAADPNDEVGGSSVTPPKYPPAVDLLVPPGTTASISDVVELFSTEGSEKLLISEIGIEDIPRRVLHGGQQDVKV